MAKANRVYTKVSIETVSLTQEQLDKLLRTDNTIYDEDNKPIVELSFNIVGYEDEDGNECHEDGEYID